MIVFNLTCSNDHRFEGWFTSLTDFEQQQKCALLNCPVCGVREVTKILHAPHVNTGGIKREPKVPSKNELQQCVNVGGAFPEEARKIHYREVPERKIRGSASSEEVGELLEEGVEVLVLPVPSH